MHTIEVDQAFLPAGLALVDELDFLPPADARLLTQVQGRSYAHLFGLIERFIDAKTFQVSAVADVNALSATLHDKCTWAVLGLACLSPAQATIVGDEMMIEFWLGSPGDTFAEQTVIVPGTWYPHDVVPGSGVDAVSVADVIPDFTETVPQISFDYGGSSPKPGVIRGDNHSTVFTGKLRPTETGQYQILGFTDDDSYVFVNGQLVSADPGGHGIPGIRAVCAERGGGLP